MLASTREMAQFTLHLDADMSGATALRRSGGEESAQVALTDLVIKACAVALTKHRRLNSRIDGDRLVEQPQINIGFAVALSEGLLVPVVRSADSLSFAAIAAQRRDLTDRARSGKLTVDDVSEATFTVSVLGLVDAFAPLINPPEAAILGVGRTAERPVVHDGQVVARPVATLSLTVDHRLVDGEPAARFLREVGRLLEQPNLLGT
jgi:pyruvate dehydrogenase E2 component (dihydrolipoamide acetyltransferase)